jgi:mRNA-degrading endonuclease RelE of RelBE toxin-antitoxin system
MPINFIELPEFEKDKKHLKKFRHLEEDIEVFKQALSTNPKSLSGVEEISEKNRKFSGNIFKARKFHSRDIPNKGCQSGFRIIYSYDNPNEKITLIEIYHHNDKDDYDRERLERNFPLN